MADTGVLPGWLDRVAAWRPLWRWLTAFALGAFADLGMAPFFLFPAYLLAFAGLFALVTGVAAQPRPVQAAAVTGWWFGFGFFFAGLFWIGEAFLVQAELFAIYMPFAVTLLPAGLGLFLALACGLWAWIGRRGIAGALLFAVLLFAAEWLRGNILTGFPWNLAAHIWGGWPSAMQGAAMLGTYGLSLVTILSASLIGALLVVRSTRARAVATGGALLLLSGSIAYGGVRLAGLEQEAIADVRIRIVQPAIDLRDKWNPEKRPEIFDIFRELTAMEGNAPTHVIWPESAVPFRLDLAEGARLKLDQAVLITGQQRAVGPEGGPYEFFNSVMIMADGQVDPAIYDKTHLVPFGEYLPFRPILSAIGLRQLVQTRGAFTPGADRRVLSPPGAPPVLPLICYEIIFPGAVNPRAGWIVNVTNDAWFGKTTGPHQHLTAVRFKAVETGLPVVRSANTGISALIGPTGQIVDSLDLGRRGIIDGALPERIQMPSFAPYRTPALAVFVLCICVVGWFLPKRMHN